MLWTILHNFENWRRNGVLQDFNINLYWSILLQEQRANNEFTQNICETVIFTNFLKEICMILMKKVWMCEISRIHIHFCNDNFTNDLDHFSSTGVQFAFYMNGVCAFSKPFWIDPDLTTLQIHATWEVCWQWRVYNNFIF